MVAVAAEQSGYSWPHRPIGADKVTVIPNGFRDEGEPDHNREHNSFRDVVQDKFVVSYFGNMGTMQDMDTILGAIRLLQTENVFFLFAGHGNKMDTLNRIVEEEKIENVKICKFLHGQAFRDALAVSDCALVSLEKGATGLCVPSKTYSYMMEGIPLLAIMDECDIVRDIETGAGLWVRNGESERLADCIRTLQNSPEDLKSMSRRCRSVYLEKYTTEICTEKYVSLFRKLL